MNHPKCLISNCFLYLVLGVVHHLLVGAVGDGEQVRRHLRWRIWGRVNCMVSHKVGTVTLTGHISVTGHYMNAHDWLQN